MTNAQTIPLPKGLPKVVRSGVPHAIALASTALSVAWGRAASSRSSRQRRGAYKAESLDDGWEVEIFQNL